MDKLDFIKIENSSGKDNVKRKRRQATDREELFARDVIRTIIFLFVIKIYKKLLKLNNNKQKPQLKKLTKDLNRFLSKEDIHMYLLGK